MLGGLWHTFATSFTGWYHQSLPPFLLETNKIHDFTVSASILKDGYSLLDMTEITLSCLDT
jgi:hypothetical protein